MGSSSDTDPRIQALVEYLCAEGGVQEDNIPRISRLIIAGNSLAPVAPASDPKPTVIETGSKSVINFYYIRLYQAKVSFCSSPRFC